MGWLLPVLSTGVGVTSLCTGVVFYQAEYWSNVTSLSGEMCVSSLRVLHNR